MKKILAVIIAAVCLLLAACGDKASADGGGNVRMTFAESIDLDRINELSGKTVEILGYMATVSPVSGKYMYLMNLPYQSCPYCVPNTQQLSNTIAVYAKDGEKFDFTDGPINVVGTLETGNFEDEYGYTYNYRIADAEYTNVNSSEASEKLALWEKIANSNLAADVYSMFNFIDFECNWPNYTAEFQEGTANLYPADVTYFEEHQYTTESSADYFENLKKRAKEIDADIMDELVTIFDDASKIVDKAKAERNAENYTYDKEADKYTLINGKSLLSEAQDLYTRYAVWLEHFSLSN